MQLIADSGSTKTAWCLSEAEGTFGRLEDTIGLNPHYIDSQGMIDDLQASLIPQLNCPVRAISHVYFYGAGCSTPPDIEIVRHALTECFPGAEIAVQHDLLGAARALCQREAGLVCILGTGSNSCYYDGQEIVDNITALGFELGDEGSGASLGRILIRSYFYRDMPEDLRQAFFDTYQLTKEKLFQNIYHRPLPNRFVAGFTKFAADHRQHPHIKKLIVQNFEEFIDRQLVKYKRCQELPIHFIGSIGIIFEEELRNALNNVGLRTGNLLKDPINGLINFHSTSEV